MTKWGERAGVEIKIEVSVIDSNNENVIRLLQEKRDYANHIEVDLIYDYVKIIEQIKKELL
ncbi:MAG: hypothetical protein R6U31_07485 [bacterium]